MAKYIKADDLNRAKFHPLPYTHITPADIEDAEAYERGWNDAIDAIIENTQTIEITTCEHCAYNYKGKCQMLSGRGDCVDVRIYNEFFCKYGEGKE